MEKLLQQYGVEHCSVQEGAVGQAVYWINSRTKNLVVFSDSNTQFVARPFANAVQHVFAESPKPEKEIAEELASQYADKDFFVAVGSGTISDLVKYASYLAQKPYVMMPTASSMNGYFSITASLIEAGKRESHIAHLPIALFADLDVLVNAPLRLISSGVGDSICRSTAQADWLLSHYLLGTVYNPEPFAMVARQERYVLTNASKLIERDKQAMQYLMEWLLLGGLGMTMCGSSYPASQGEHMIAHTMEMLYGDELPETFHGEQIGVTTLIMAEMQQEILRKDKLKLLPKALPEKEINLQKMNEINQNLAKNWKKISTEIQKITRPASEIASVLNAVNAPISAQMLGWEKRALQQAVTNAHTTRNRFTFLDIAVLTHT